MNQNKDHGKERFRFGSFDHALREGISDVEVPADLRDRLLARLESTHLDSPTSTHEVSSPETLMLRSAATTTRNHRRRWLTAASSILAASVAGVVVTALLLPSADRALTADAVMNLARSQLVEVVAKDDIAITTQRPPTRYPLGDFVPASMAVAWQRLPSGSLNRAGVVYRLVGPANESARLMVVDLQGSRGAPVLAQLPRVATQNVLSTGGYTSSAWSDGTRLYVLVVEGDVRQFQQFLRQPGTVA
jgi:hypothetical protein